MFGSGERPFVPTGVAKRANDAWTTAELDPIGLHDARHAAASILIAAGVNAKALSVYMGHASITITLDRYGHLFPGNEEEAAALVDPTSIAWRASPAAQTSRRCGAWGGPFGRNRPGRTELSTATLAAPPQNLPRQLQRKEEASGRFNPKVVGSIPTRPIRDRLG